MKRAMKNLIVIGALLLALCAGATNITNYPVVTTFDGNVWFLLSSVPNQTNYNLPGNYVASTASLNSASNALFILIQAASGFFKLNTNNVATGTSNTFNGDIYINGRLIVNSPESNSILVDIYANSITLTNGLTNLSLTANTVLKADGNKAPTSIPNGLGSLTNDNAGNFGWRQMAAGSDILNYSNNVNTLLTSLSNNVITQVATNTPQFGTNALATADFSKDFGWTNSSVAVTFPAPINLPSPLNKAPTCVVMVTNSSGTPFGLTTFANCHVVPGSVAWCTNVTACTFHLYGNAMTNVYFVPLF